MCNWHHNPNFIEPAQLSLRQLRVAALTFQLHIPSGTSMVMLGGMAWEEGGRMACLRQGEGICVQGNAE